MDNYSKWHIDKIVDYNGTCLRIKKDISADIVVHFNKYFKNQSSADILEGTEFFEGVRFFLKPPTKLMSRISLIEIVL
jgi:hypothetical protein